MIEDFHLRLTNVAFGDRFYMPWVEWGEKYPRMMVDGVEYRACESERFPHVREVYLVHVAFCAYELTEEDGGHGAHLGFGEEPDAIQHKYTATASDFGITFFRSRELAQQQAQAMALEPFGHLRKRLDAAEVL